MQGQDKANNLQNELEKKDADLEKAVKVHLTPTLTLTLTLITDAAC